MKHIGIIAALAAFTALAASCDIFGGDNNSYKPLELSTKSSEFVEKGNTFTFKYIERIDKASEGDYIVSPLSMQFLLGMILNGAQGATADEICNVLGYGAGEIAEVNEYVRTMLDQLPDMDKKTTLTIANAIFVDEGWPLLDSYENTVEKYYDSEVDDLNFMDSKASLDAINGWCSKQTKKMIPKVLDDIDPDMLCYLLNAMYFKSQWKEKFTKSVTADEEFTYENGGKGTVKMMKQEKDHPYAENDIYQMVRLPYGNGAFSMIVFLPKEKYTVSDIAATLVKSDWRELRYDMVTCNVDLWLPKFETKYHIKLNDILSEMGMPLSFDPDNADFKAMSNYAGYLSFVQQDAVIKVDEEGTEAAVVSVGGMKKDAAIAPGDHVVFHADHPFLYLITESGSGTVLFAGKYSGK